MLYPIRFKPQYQYRLWGGNKLRDSMGKTDAPEKTGESWEISALQGAVSIVSNGFLAGNSLEEIIEVYLDDLVGESVYDRFGIEFPLLIKLIDAQDILSVQVHPDDSLARNRHAAYGKTEMWYILQADEDAMLYSGFNKKLDKEQLLKHIDKKTLKEVLNVEKASAGDAFFIPAGRVHATGPGLLLAEIQQTSDITYRLYDWDRLEKDGKPRELHVDLALDAIDYKIPESYRTHYNRETNRINPLISCPYFTTHFISIDQSLDRDYQAIDSFVIYLIIKGEMDIVYRSGSAEQVKTGETILIPASLKEIRLEPRGMVELLEIYVEVMGDE